MVWVSILAWPVIAAILFGIFALPTAIIMTLLGGFLLLPSNFSYNVPVLPDISKETVPTLAALLLTLFALQLMHDKREVLSGWIPKNNWVRLFLALTLFGGLGTALTNGAPLVLGGKNLPGLRIYDGLSICMDALVMLVPFLLARKALATVEGQRKLLITLVVLAAGYALLALWEVRMSPQLHNRLYGYFPHSWNQHVRDGGYRPLVFLNHALVLGIFMASANIAAGGLLRAGDTPRRPLYIFAVLWLFGVLFLSKVLGAFLIVLILLPITLFFPTRLQLLAATGVAILTLCYPVLRNIDVIPTQTAVALAERVSPGRAQSLNFRFVNEDLLLERANEKRLFGWGAWGRNRAYDDRGRDVSTTDGRWVILFGQGGWVRYIGEFGLLTVGILGMFFRRRRYIHPIDVAMALTLSAQLVNLLPNSAATPLTWMMAGALVGRLEYASDGVAPESEAATSPQERQTIPYRRPQPNLIQPEVLRHTRAQAGDVSCRRSDLTPKIRRRQT